MVKWLNQILTYSWNVGRVVSACNPVVRGRCHDILGLSADEARQRFNAGVEAGDFVVEYGVIEDNPLLSQLPPSARDLFSRMAKIEVVQTGHLVDRNDIMQVSSLPDFTVLGYTGDMEVILCKSSSDGIYLLDEGDELEDLLIPAYPTTYHWLLCQAFPFK